MRLSPWLAIATAVSFALGFPFAAVAVPASSPATVILVRFAASAVILGILALALRLPWPSRMQAVHAAITGIVGQGVQFIGVYTALQHDVPPALVALVVAMNPVLTAAVAAGLLGESLTVRRSLALVLGVAAVLAALAGRLLEVGSVPAAVAFAAGGLAGISLGGIYQQRYLHAGHSMTNYTVGLFAALVPTAILGAFTSIGVSDWHGFAVNTALIVLFNGLISSLLYMVCVKQGGAAATSMIFGVIPSIAAVASWIMLGQRLDIGIAIGLVLGALSCYLGYSRSGRAPRTTAVTVEGLDEPAGPDGPDVPADPVGPVGAVGPTRQD
ncbi:DMT family transporter [Dietzia sp.]|uniref:DMT family transporter n=1 Tax=Dietzia sp. TaxID=1871616 RepID=UPI002FDA8681